MSKKSVQERLLSLFESRSSFDSISTVTVMGSGASNTVRVTSLDRRKDSKYRETKSIGERFRMRKHSTGEMLEETPSSSNAKQKKIYDLSKSLENALLTINKQNKRLSAVEHERDEAIEELTWLRKYGCRADQSAESRQSSVVSLEAGDDAIRLQLRQALHDLKLARLESMKWKEERDTMAIQCTKKEARLANYERDLQIARVRVTSLEELVRRQLGELTLEDVVFNGDSVSMTSDTKKSTDDAADLSESTCSRAVSVLSSVTERPPSRPGPVRVVSAGRCRRESTPKQDKITEDIDHLLGDLPATLILEPEDATFDELKEKVVVEELSTRKYRQGSPRYRSPSLTNEAPRHLPPLQKYRDKNVISLPRAADKRPMTAAPVAERRMILGRNASVPFIESNPGSVEEDGADFLNIDDLLNAEEPPANIRSQSGKSRDSGFTEASLKTVHAIV